MKAYPDLTAAGFLSQGPDLQTYRDEMLSDHFRGECDLARTFLLNYSKLKKISRRQTSYGLKHRAERNIRAAGAERGYDYVSNGALIVAGLLEGYQIERVGKTPNAFLNISARPWREPDRYADPDPSYEFADLPCAAAIAAWRGRRSDQVANLATRSGNVIPFPGRGV
jgi:hypothetical protein